MTIQCFSAIILLLSGLSFVGGSAHGQDNIWKIHCVCIDAGHGGKDPGSVGKKNVEKTITLSVALQVGKLIKEQNPDVKVIYTREKDEFIELRERGVFANKNKADIFISIHCNSVESKSITGVETYMLGPNKTEDNLRVAQNENSVIKYEDDYSIKYAGFDPDKPESSIIFELMQKNYRDQSFDLAELVQQELLKEAGKVNRDLKQAGFLVLKDVAMPSILVELGFISNVEEERYLASIAGQAEMSESIARAFKKYKDKFERNSVVLSYGHSNQAEEVFDNKPAEKSSAAVKGAGKPTEKVADKPAAQSDTLFYAIQVASSLKKMKPMEQYGKGNGVQELYSGKRYCYFVAKSATYQEVRGKLPDIKKVTKDCFIIAVYKGRIINVADAIKME
ncbi:N-acetylmuramoyl-L-alanine amidase [Bacteroidia bacterium]|nr:N-acetylmuramoyl-L-alanine amidase [Bacteroidia bacterium]